MRKLVSIQKISEIKPHPNADAIELATVRGWQVVVKRGEFKPGDFAVYFEIDSFLPIREEFEFLRKSCFRTHPELGDGFRLRTIKLRGELSQGLLLPISILENHKIKTNQEVQCVGRRIWDEKWQCWSQCIVPLEEGADLTEFLEVQKYEPPVPTQLAGNAKGNFPSFIRKTDQERCCSENTVIETEDGHKTIREICEQKYSGKVKAFNECAGNVFSRVTGWTINSPTPTNWLKITTKSGKTLIVTREHKVFLVALGVYREACFLKTGDTVYSIN